MKRIIKINQADNVAVVLTDGVEAGEVFDDGTEKVTSQSLSDADISLRCVRSPRARQW